MHSLGETFAESKKKLKSAILPLFSAVKPLVSLKDGLLMEVSGEREKDLQSHGSLVQDQLVPPYHNMNSVLIYLFPEQRARKARSI